MTPDERNDSEVKPLPMLDVRKGGRPLGERDQGAWSYDDDPTASDLEAVRRGMAHNRSLVKST